MAKLLITNGVIYDGLGNAPFRGKVYIEDEVIKKVFRDGEDTAELETITQEAEIVDAQGKTVTPGFIDIHRHCDIQPFYGTDFGKVMLAQGITTTVAGNCGFSMVPVPQDEAKAEEMFAFAEPVVGPAYRGIYTYGQYMDALDKLKLPLNFASMIGSGTVKIAVKGFSNTPFTEAEMKKASDYIEDALEKGAVGVSAGIMYLPECYNSTDDYAKMLAPMEKYHTPLCVHIRGEGDSMVDSVKEVIEIGKKVGCPVEISHFKSCGMANWRKEIHRAIELIEQARKEGQDVTCDFYPYEGGSTSLTTMVPPAFVDGDMNRALERMGTKEGVEEFCKSLEINYDDWDNFAITLGWDRILISGVHKQSNQKFVGKMVSDAAKEYGFESDGAFVAWLLHDEEGKVAIINMSMCQDDIDTVAKLPYSNVISDSIYAVTDTPHPRMYGAFPKIIREYVQERHLYTMEEAIRKMTSLPAARMSIARRGQIAEGYYADINIFDPAELKDHATFEKPVQLASGIAKCFVNGKLAWEDGKLCNDACGKNLRRTDE